jgi:hypothetical protein
VSRTVATGQLSGDFAATLTLSRDIPILPPLPCPPPPPAHTYTRHPHPNYPFQRYTSGVINHAQLTDLVPGSTYYYQISPIPNASSPLGPAVASEVLSFVLPPASGDPAVMSFAVVGDLGQTNDSLSTLEHIAYVRPPVRPLSLLRVVSACIGRMVV